MGVRAFDQEVISLLQAPKYLDAHGDVARTLSDSDVRKIQSQLKQKLGLNVTLEEAKLLGDRFVTDARLAGKNWRTKVSLANYYRSNPGTHGFTAEIINFEDLAKRNVEIRFTSANSKSVDIIGRDRFTNRIKFGIQTKAYASAKGSLASGVDDAQTFFADKSLRAKFEVHIPMDQFEELVRNNTLSPAGRVLAPEGFAKQLDNKFANALQHNQSAAGSNNARLLGITKKHGDVATYNRRVVQNVTVVPLSSTYKRIIERSNDTTRLRSTILGKSAYAAYVKSLPSNFSLAKNAGIVASVFTALPAIWQGDLSVDSIQGALVQGGEAAGAAYIASGIMRKYGKKVVFNTYINSAELGRERAAALLKSIPAKDRLAFARHMGRTAFLATFIFDETGVIVNFAQGGMEVDDFLFESGVNLARASTVGAAVWGSVALGAGPGGLVVTAVSIGAYALVCKVEQYARSYVKRQNLSLDDFIGSLPIEIANRMTPFEASQVTVFDQPEDGWPAPTHSNPFVPVRHDPFTPPGD
ncbi:hypothetical protein N9293_00325 [Planctomycetota bacterium]|nr:hypothetical protein [Planctomycetota bacterium]MDC1043716.1 hypothetical protein [bacterium]